MSDQEGFPQRWQLFFSLDWPDKGRTNTMNDTWSLRLFSKSDMEDVVVVLSTTLYGIIHIVCII
jgi:hypothetical protein